MISNIIFLSFLCSGSVFAAAWKGRRFEEILPITAMGMVLLVFLLGIAGHLYAGVVVCAIISAALWLLAIAHVIWKKDVKQTAIALLTPGAVVFVLMFFCLIFLNFGRLASVWDEYSHWIDVVKAMTLIDDFGTNPNAHTFYQLYPPAISIFQYILQKINLWIKPDGAFSEWRTYSAYQVFLFIPVFPFFKKCSIKRPLNLLLYCLTFFATPLMFFGFIHKHVYADPVLGILSGVGIAMILLWDNKDLLYSCTIWMICSILVLSKDVGLMFALFVALIYALDILTNNQARNEISGFKKGAYITAAAAATIIPKILWSLEIWISNAAIRFSNPIDFKELFLIVFGAVNKIRSVRAEIWNTYDLGLFEKTVSVGHTGIAINYFNLSIIFFLAFYFIYRLYAKKLPEKRKTYASVFVVLVIEMIVYIFGMGVMYMYKFNGYEGATLAAINRYLNIVFLSDWIVVILLCINATEKWFTERTVTVMFLSFMLVVTPWKDIINFVSLNTLIESEYFRKEYEQMEAEIQEYSAENDTVCLVTLNDLGEVDYMFLHMIARPSILETRCFMEDENDAINISPEEWREELIEKYDYVALFRMKDYFKERYAEVFENPADICENSLYSVDKKTGLLTKCSELNENFLSNFG